MTQPLVSIIVPCYNQAEYLPETLDSVLKQTNPLWECVIVNDGSPDNTEEVASKYCKMDSRFIYVYKENGGLASARNYGIQHSHGEYILPLDADDLIGATYIEDAMCYFDEHPEIKIVYCKAEKFGVENGEWVLPEYSYNQLLWQNLIFCTCFYRRSDYDKTNGYNPNMKYGFEDWDFLLSFLNQEDVVYQIPKTLFFYRTKSASMLSAVGEKVEYTLRQLGKNHPEVYMPYSDEILWLYYAVSYYKNSLPYRLGKKILGPYRFIKSKLFGKKYQEL